MSRQTVSDIAHESGNRTKKNVNSISSTAEIDRLQKDLNKALEMAFRWLVEEGRSLEGVTNVKVAEMAAVSERTVGRLKDEIVPKLETILTKTDAQEITNSHHEKGDLKMNVMSRAHAYARAHRSEFESYKEALRQGLKLAHAEARSAREEPGTKMCGAHEPAEGENGLHNFVESTEAINPHRSVEVSEVRGASKIGLSSVKHELLAAYDTPETRAAAIIREGVQKYRARIPLLCQDWKAEGYDGRRDFRAWMR